MRIQSRFTDYYDFATPYRDTDERAYFWDRRPDQETEEFYELRKKWTTKPGRVVQYNMPKFEDARTSRWLRWDHSTPYVMTVGSKSISFYGHTKYNQETPEPETYSTAPDFEHVSWKTWTDDFQREVSLSTAPEVFNTDKYPFLVEYQMKHRTPTILFAARDRHVYIDVNPCLKDYGIQHVLPDAQQVYQDLEAWFTDGRFDADPPEVQTDIQKVVSHGFDRKKSFRKMPRD